MKLSKNALLGALVIGGLFAVATPASRITDMVVIIIIGQKFEMTGVSYSTIVLSYVVICAMAQAAPRSLAIGAKSAMICENYDKIIGVGAMTAGDIVLGGAGNC